MKIALIAPSEIPAMRANTIQVMKMAQACVELNHQVHLISPKGGLVGDPQSKKPTWEELAHHYGLSHRFEIEWLPAHRDMRRYDFSLRALAAANRFNADILYTRLPQAAAIASRLGKPTIYELHDIPQGSFGPWMLRAFMKGSGKRRLVVITNALARDLEKKYGITLKEPFTLVAPDGVDLARYQNLLSPKQSRIELKTRSQDSSLKSLNDEVYTIGYSGHLYPGRGIELMMELASYLPQFNFLIVGGEPAQVEIYRQAAASRGLSNLILTGFVPNADLPTYQAACDLLLMPYEGRVSASSGGDISRYLSPMKLFEYLACERPIIASSLPVLHEVLHQDNAVLISDTQTENWRQAVLSIYQNPSLASSLAVQARKDAASYTWSERARKILHGIEI